MVAAADHAHLLLSWQSELELCWATFGEDACDRGHINWIDVLPDVPFNPGGVSVLGCVLIVDVADDKLKVKGKVNCTRSEFCDSFRADFLLGRVVKAFVPQRRQIHPGESWDSCD